MEQDLFKSHLEAAVYCQSDYYGCSNIKTPGWVRLLGWGNYNAKVCFVGINPLLSEKAIVWHWCPVGRATEEHAGI